MRNRRLVITAWCVCVCVSVSVCDRVCVRVCPLSCQCHYLLCAHTPEYTRLPFQRIRACGVWIYVGVYLQLVCVSTHWPVFVICAL